MGPAMGKQVCGGDLRDVTSPHDQDAKNVNYRGDDTEDLVHLLSPLLEDEVAVVVLVGLVQLRSGLRHRSLVRL
jgi:hypothetical protein